MYDPETAGAVATSRAMEPATSRYIHNVLTGQMMELPPPYDPTKSFAEHALDPHRQEISMNLALGLGGAGLGTKMPTVYHGSARPLEGGRFDPAKLLSGEGWHGEGFGGYVSEAERVAQWYRDTYGKFTDEHGDLAFEALKDKLNMTSMELSDFMYKMGFDSAIPEHIVDLAARHIDTYVKPQTGHVYEMQYPGAEIEHFLRWDRPVIDQSEYVKKALSRMGIRQNAPAHHDWQSSTNSTWGPLTGEEVYNFLGTKYGTWQKDMNVNPSGDPATAAVMRLNGIRGTRYPASEIHYPKGTVFNYSVFSPENLEVIKKYGMGPLLVGGGAAGFAHGFQAEEVDHNPFE